MSLLYIAGTTVLVAGALAMAILVIAAMAEGAASVVTKFRIARSPSMAAKLVEANENASYRRFSVKYAILMSLVYIVAVSFMVFIGSAIYVADLIPI